MIAAHQMPDGRIVEFYASDDIAFVIVLAAGRSSGLVGQATTHDEARAVAARLDRPVAIERLNHGTRAAAA